MTLWHPISTAPKDGTEILGFGDVVEEIQGDIAKNRIGVILWAGDYYHKHPHFSWQYDTQTVYCAWMNATHWMPLPAPPSSTTEEATA